jgi:DMSO/TMAO reductase YedYZ molybdopterin-dependent catalytic subunit
VSAWGGYSTSREDLSYLEVAGTKEQDGDVSLENPVPAPSDARALRRTGALATAAALAFLWVASVWEAVSFAPAALAGALLRAAPGGVATFFIETLGHWARPLLVGGVLVLAMALGAEILVRTAAHGTPRPQIAASTLGLVAAVASLIGTSPGADAAPTLLAVAGAALLYAFVVRSSTPTQYVSDAEVGQSGRREFLRVSSGATAGLVIGGAAAGWLLRRLGGPDTDVALVAASEPAVVPVRDDFPDIPGLTPEITSADDHYVVDINLIPPKVEAEGWSLDVRGEVDHPAKYTFASLQSSFDVVEEFAVLTCISNEVNGQLIGHSRWGGVRLSDVLGAAGPRDAAMDVVFYGADGYSDSIPLEVAMHPTVILAVSQNGKPLQQAHGFPCRVRVPAIYGMKNVKWLEAIEIVPTDYQGYWMKRGWSDVAIIDTESRIDVAGDSGRASVGQETWIAGIAWAGIRGIDKVEVSVDGGTTWAEAMLRDPISPISWRHWAYRWRPERAGRTMVQCRATDGDGRTQVMERAAPHPDGATGYPMKLVEVA